MSAKSEPLVLMYHSVEPYREDPFRITVRPERLAAQLDWLRRRGLHGTSMGQLLRARAAGGGAGLVGLTFDDGYADFVTEVMPMLAGHGFTATVYVVAGALGGDNGWDRPGPHKALMTGADVRVAAAAGMEIGSHSLSHRRLTALDPASLTAEVRRSRAVLSEESGQEVSGFCYPYGAVGAREVDAVRAAGYDHACAVAPAALPARYAIPRTYIGDRDTSLRLLAKWGRHRVREHLGLRRTAR